MGAPHIALCAAEGRAQGQPFRDPCGAADRGLAAVLGRVL